MSIAKLQTWHPERVFESNNLKFVINEDVEIASTAEQDKHLSERRFAISNTTSATDNKAQGCYISHLQYPFALA